MLLVLGGTGKVGREVIAQLTREGIPTRALVRREHGDLGSGVQSFLGDIADASSVAAALRNVDRVFLLTPPRPDEGAVKSAVINACVSARVKHVVLLSGAGARQKSPISQAREHATTEAYLRASGLGFTILQPYFFMQNVLGQAGAIASHGAVFGNFGRGALAMIDTRDIAAVAVACLRQEGHAGQTYVLTGGEALTHAEVARALSALLGRPIGYVDLPSAQLAPSLAASGTPAWLARDLTLLGEEIASGQFAEPTDVVERICKRPPLLFEAFVRDHAATFRQALDQH